MNLEGFIQDKRHFFLPDPRVVKVNLSSGHVPRKQGFRGISSLCEDTEGWQEEQWVSSCKWSLRVDLCIKTFSCNTLSSLPPAPGGSCPACWPYILPSAEAPGGPCGPLFLSWGQQLLLGNLTVLVIWQGVWDRTAETTGSAHELQEIHYGPVLWGIGEEHDAFTQTKKWLCSWEVMQCRG